MKKIAQGAEATIFLDRKKIVKERFRKGYRIPEIDEKLRKGRTRREAKLIEKLNLLGIAAPKFLECDEKEMKISMEYIGGKRLRDVLEKLDYAKICKKVGEQVALLHNNGIIHGDLTTSNMILKQGKIYFIDFGLSFYSEKVEDKAVDIHLLRQALESKHYKIWEKAFRAVLQGYSRAGSYKEIMARLKAVEERGRYKHKGCAKTG